MSEPHPQLSGHELVSVVSAVGVKVAVQVVPPSAEDTALRVPLAMVRSALLKPLTASEKVMVTPEVSPAASAARASRRTSLFM